MIRQGFLLQLKPGAVAATLLTLVLSGAADATHDGSPGASPGLTPDAAPIDVLDGEA